MVTSLKLDPSILLVGLFSVSSALSCIFSAEIKFGDKGLIAYFEFLVCLPPLICGRLLLLLITRMVPLVSDWVLMRAFTGSFLVLVLILLWSEILTDIRTTQYTTSLRQAKLYLPN